MTISGVDEGLVGHCIWLMIVYNNCALTVFVLLDLEKLRVVCCVLSFWFLLALHFVGDVYLTGSVWMQGFYIMSVRSWSVVNTEISVGQYTQTSN